MKKLVYIILLAFLNSIATAGEVKNKIYNSASEQLSHGISKIIPGEGVTEVSIEITDETDDEPDFSILAVRDILLQDNSNFFTQFSLRNTKVQNDNRLYGNFGIGYRVLSPDQNFMFGVNSFFDQDIRDKHQRASVGLEAKGSIIDLSINKYQKTTGMKVVNGNEEQVLSGWDYNITTQLPHMPWAKFNLEGYKNEKEKAPSDLEGDVFSLELVLNPSMQLDLSFDESDVTGVNDVYSAQLNFVYPPKEEEHTMVGGFSENTFEKENMEKKLREKVRRNNKLTVEIQGAVIITSK
jgi:hypothetical protein